MEKVKELSYIEVKSLGFSLFQLTPDNICTYLTLLSPYAP